MEKLSSRTQRLFRARNFSPHAGKFDFDGLQFGAWQRGLRREEKNLRVVEFFFHARPDQIRRVDRQTDSVAGKKIGSRGDKNLDAARTLSTGDTFTLDSDFDLLKGTKPATLVVAETEIKMPHWNHLLREIVRQLYAIDQDIFRRATQMENVRKTLFTTEPTDFKIDENFFMLTGFSTEDCLKYAKVLVENFDRLSEMNFKDEISFTLKK